MIERLVLLQIHLKVVVMLACWILLTVARELGQRMTDVEECVEHCSFGGADGGAGSFGEAD